MLGLLPLLDLLDLGPGIPLGEDFVVFTETLALNTAIQQWVSVAVARPRPLSYSGDPGNVTGSTGYVSFYAGHLTTVIAAFSVASFTLRQRYGEMVWPWIVTGAVGTSVAVERVLALAGTF